MILRRSYFKAGFAAAIGYAVALTANAYDRDAVLLYAKTFWNNPNHSCESTYIECTPWSYWGQEACGYPSHGGDCANFVSQCVLAGGESDLNNEPNGICRGYPCEREEIGADKLSQCLVTYHGWQEAGSGDTLVPPPSIVPGDVLIYCNSTQYGTHAVVVVSAGNGKAAIACHSTAHYDISYDYMKDPEHRYYRWLHNPAENTHIAGNREIADSSVIKIKIFSGMHISDPRMTFPLIKSNDISFRIINSKGITVYRFRGREIKGNEIAWYLSGNDENKIIPNTAYYMVMSSGSIIIAARRFILVR